MPRWVALLSCLFLVGCSGATKGVRPRTGQEKLCAYIPQRDMAPPALDYDGKAAVPAPSTLGAGSPATPLSPSQPPPLQGLPGEGGGNGIPRGVLRLVPPGGAAAGGAGTAAAAAEALVTGGALIAAAGSVVLLCVTIKAVVDGAETPIDIADKFYGTHFGDVSGWLQGQHAANATAHSNALEIDIYLHYASNGTVTVVTGAPKPQTASASAPHTPPSGWPDSQRDKGDKKKQGRLYVTYTKINKKTNRYYSGRTSMIVDLGVRLDVQAELAVQFRNMNHHIDENEEPDNALFDAARLDVFDVGTAIDYGKRYDDPAYWRIRGREQQLIDFHGGAQSDTGRPHRTENVVRAVAKDNPRGRRFHDAATTHWGQFYYYTGY